MLITLTLFVSRSGVRGERPNLKFHEEIYTARLSKLSGGGCPVCPYRVPVSHKGKFVKFYFGKKKFPNLCCKYDTLAAFRNCSINKDYDTTKALLISCALNLSVLEIS